MSEPTRAPRPWRPSGLVTLLTDYGLDDPYVGMVKGVLWRDAPRLRAVIDLTHAVPAGDVATGAFLLARAWTTFPAGSVHVAIVDPGVGTQRALLLVEARGHVFLGPDNGLLALVIAAIPMAVIAAAIVSESIGWTIAVLTGLIFVFGNVVLQVAPRLRWVGRYVREMARGGPALPVTLGAEAAGIAVVVVVMLALQGRKTSFV